MHAMKQSDHQPNVCSTSTETIAYMITYGFSAAVRYVIVYCHCGRTYACSFTVIFIHSVHRCLVLLGTSQHPGVERDRCGERGQAKNAVSVTMKLSVLLGLSFVLFLALCHDLWASLYSGSAVIVFGWLIPGCCC